MTDKEYTWNTSLPLSCFHNMSEYRYEDRGRGHDAARGFVFSPTNQFGQITLFGRRSNRKQIYVTNITTGSNGCLKFCGNSALRLSSAYTAHDTMARRASLHLTFNFSHSHTVSCLQRNSKLVGCVTIEISWKSELRYTITCHSVKYTSPSSERGPLPSIKHLSPRELPITEPLCA